MASLTDNSKIFPEDPRFSNYSTRFNKSLVEILDALNLIDTLGIWKYETPFSESFYDFQKKILAFNDVAVEAIKLKYSSNINRTELFREYKDKLIDKRKDVIELYKFFTDLTYDKIFISKPLN